MSSPSGQSGHLSTSLRAITDPDNVSPAVLSVFSRSSPFLADRPVRKKSSRTVVSPSPSSIRFFCSKYSNTRGPCCSRYSSLAARSRLMSARTEASESRSSSSSSSGSSPLARRFLIRSLSAVSKGNRVSLSARNASSRAWCRVSRVVAVGVSPAPTRLVLARNAGMRYVRATCLTRPRCTNLFCWKVWT